MVLFGFSPCYYSKVILRVAYMVDSDRLCAGNSIKLVLFGFPLCYYSKVILRVAYVVDSDRLCAGNTIYIYIYIYMLPSILLF